MRDKGKSHRNMFLSVVLATFNEERNISDCLNSVTTIADEMIVVDGKSQDATGEIARKLGAKVIVTDNKPQFHANKQLGVEAAKGEWILQLDADERVTPELAQEIIQLIKSNPEENGFALPRRNWFLGRFLKKGGAYPDPVVRLFRRGKGRFPESTIITNGITTSNVHAQINVDGKVGILHSDLIHYGDRDISKYLLRFNRYTSLEAENLIALGTRSSFLKALDYIIFKPVYWFLIRYLRHKGFMDGYQGFLFSLLSALHYPVIFFKLFELQKTNHD